MGKSILKNYIYNNILLIFNLSYPLLTTIYINNILSLEKIGEINYSLSIVNIFIVLSSLGIQNYGVREISTNKNNLNKIFWELFILNGIAMGIFYMILIVVTVNFFHSYFILVMIFSFNLLTSIFNLDWFYIGIEEFGYITKRSIIIKILSILWMLVLIKTEDDTIIYAILLCCGYSFNSFFNAIHLKKYIKKIPLNLNILIHLKKLKYFYFTVLIGIFGNGGDQLILGFFSNMNEVAYYSRNRQIIGISSAVLLALFQSITPRTNELFIKNRNEYTRILYLSSEITLFLIIPLFSITLFLGRDLLFIIGKNKFLEGLNSLQILSFVILFSGISTWLNYQVCIPEKKEKAIFYGLIFLNIFNWSFILKIGYKFGAAGVSLGLVIGEIINLVIIILTLKKFKIKCFFLRKEDIAFFISGIFSVVSIKILKSSSSSDSIKLSMFYILLYGILYLFFIILIDKLLLKEFYIKMLKKEFKNAKNKKIFRDN